MKNCASRDYTHTHTNTHTNTYTYTQAHAQRVGVFVCLSVCLSVFVCVANVRIVKSRTFVWLSCFQIIFNFWVDSPNKKPREARFFLDSVKRPLEALFFFLDSVTVNTVVHTESEACQKQCYPPQNPRSSNPIIPSLCLFLFLPPPPAFLSFSSFFPRDWIVVD